MSQYLKEKLVKFVFENKRWPRASKPAERLLHEQLIALMNNDAVFCEQIMPFKKKRPGAKVKGKR